MFIIVRLCVRLTFVVEIDSLTTEVGLGSGMFESMACGLSSSSSSTVKSVMYCWVLLYPSERAQSANKKQTVTQVIQIK